jgi:hypothetical protein
MPVHNDEKKYTEIHLRNVKAREREKVESRYVFFCFFLLFISKLF